MGDAAELVRRMLAGDREAAAAIYDRYAPLVRAVVLDATGSLPDADELVQEVFVRGLTRVGQLRRLDRLGAWLVAIARREGKEFRRRAARKRQRFISFTDGPAPRAVTVSDTVAVVGDAVAELPERERMAIHIHYLCGEPVEIARKMLGVSRSGFYRLLERARDRLRSRLLESEKRR
jgi:RNA polymerase sigma-70 factor, ECF subfamily